jgi:hypothetical protein
MEARVTAYSQSNRLRDRMAEAEVRHGEEVRADVRGVRVQVSSPAWIGRRDIVKGDVFFCTMGPVEVRRVSIEGDGDPLPDHTILEGLQVPIEGTYDLINVLIRWRRRPGGRLERRCSRSSRLPSRATGRRVGRSARESLPGGLGR